MVPSPAPEVGSSGASLTTVQLQSDMFQTNPKPPITSMEPTASERLQRLMKDCHVPVLVPLADWQRRVRLRRENELMPELDVDMDYLLLGLYHENLITAARKKLGLTNQWWIVDIYVMENEGELTGGKNCGIRIIVDCRART